MPPDLDRLEQLANAATPDWTRDLYSHGGSRIYSTHPRKLIADTFHREDTEFIFAADPQTILALIAKVRRLQADLGIVGQELERMRLYAEALRDAAHDPEAES